MQALKCILFYLFLCYKNGNAIRGLKVFKMGKVSKNGKQLGRPKGSNGRQLGGYVVKQIEQSMQILERRGTSLAEIIANRLCEDKPEAMLAIISKYTPLDVQVEVTASDSIADALANVQAVMASNRAKVIDVEPDE